MRTECSVRRSGVYVYEHGEKEGRLCAHQLKCKSILQLIPHMWRQWILLKWMIFLKLIILKYIYTSDEIFNNDYLES